MPTAATIALASWTGVWAGYTGGTVGWVLGDSPGMAAIGGTVGAAAGGLTPFLVLDDERFTLRRAVTIDSLGAVGTWTGIEAARWFVPPGAEAETERILAAGAAGGAAGTVLGVLVPAPEPGTMLLADTGLLAGWQAAAGASSLAGLTLPEDRALRAPLALGGGAAFFGTALLARHLGSPLPDGPALALGLGHGAWLGLWTPYLFEPDPAPERFLSGLQVGLGAGWLGTLAVAPLTPSRQSVALQSTGIGVGQALGAGIPLALGAGDTPSHVVGPMMAAGIVGQALGATVAPHYDLDPDQAFTLATLETWTAFQAAGWATWGWSDDEDRGLAPWGYALTAVGAGTVTSMVAAPLLPARPAGTLMGVSGGAWGAWFGACGSHLAGVDTPTSWNVTLNAGNGALLATTVATSTFWRPAWKDVAVVDGAGVIGGALGAMVGVIASPEEDAVVVGAVAGSAAGLVTGALVGLPLEGADRLDGGLPRLPRVRLPFQTRFSLAPWTDREGQPGAWIQVEAGRRRTGS